MKLFVIIFSAILAAAVVIFGASRWMAAREAAAKDAAKSLDLIVRVMDGSDELISVGSAYNATILDGFFLFPREVAELAKRPFPADYTKDSALRKFKHRAEDAIAAARKVGGYDEKKFRAWADRMEAELRKNLPD